MSIKNREGYVEPAGVPELLLKRELKSRYDNNRKNMIYDLRLQGKTIQQREAELWDELLLENAIFFCPVVASTPAPKLQPSRLKLEFI